MSETQLRICTDCAMLIANGECSDADGNDIATELAVRIAYNWPTAVIAVGEPDGFSWAMCGACHSPLGGDRYTATAFER